MALTVPVPTAIARRLGVTVTVAIAVVLGSLWDQARVDDAQFRGSETVPYNSRFTFTRIRYDTPRGSRGGFRGGFGGSAWAHDYPMADLNMQIMLNEFTGVHANTDGSNVFELENRQRGRAARLREQRGIARLRDVDDVEPNAVAFALQREEDLESLTEGADGDVKDCERHDGESSAQASP